MALQDMLEKEPVLLIGITELDETFVLDCYKGKPVPKEANRNARNDVLRSYNNLGAAIGCTVMDINPEENKKLFNLNVVNNLHS